MQPWREREEEAAPLASACFSGTVTDRSAPSDCFPALVKTAGRRPHEATTLSEYRQGRDIRPRIRGRQVGPQPSGAVDLTLYHLANGELTPMGGSHDLMDPISHHGAEGIALVETINRQCLRSIMASRGFRSYDCEWWHYTLEDESYPDTYFDFPITCWTRTGGRVTAPRVVVAGGHSAGHIEPAMNFADALRQVEPEAEVTALGTVRGLDTMLIPARGYPLELIPPAPLPRTLNRALLRTPGRLRDSVRAAGAVLDRVRAEIVVGFGGYVAAKAYLAARSRGLPIVVHEANARPGVANRLAARMTTHVFTAGPAVQLAHATAIGIPLRRAITGLDRPAVRTAARQRFGLRHEGPVLMATGGSQGARAISAAVSRAAAALRMAACRYCTSPGRGTWSRCRTEPRRPALRRRSLRRGDGVRLRSGRLRDLPLGRYDVRRTGRCGPARRRTSRCRCAAASSG